MRLIINIDKGLATLYDIITRNDEDETIAVVEIAGNNSDFLSTYGSYEGPDPEKPDN
jgi:hypothetical protein